MKSTLEPMNLDDIEVLLRRAASLSNHRHYVIAGSLSALGATLNAPAEMVMSRDVDLYPKLDPGRGFLEIASEISEGTPFAKEHGFYADPITPRLLTLPQGWEPRLLQIPLGSGRDAVVAWFLDPVDAAVSKLVRGEVNDVRWVTAGLREGLIHKATLMDRMRTAPTTTEEGRIAGRALYHCLQSIDHEDASIEYRPDRDVGSRR